MPYEDGMFDNGHFELLLAEQPSIDMQNVKLPVKEDIDIFNRDNEKIATLKKGEYSFISTIGTAGGFELRTLP